MDYETRNHVEQIWVYLQTMGETVVKLERRIRKLEGGINAGKC